MFILHEYMQLQYNVLASNCRIDLCMYMYSACSVHELQLNSVHVVMNVHVSEERYYQSAQFVALV